MAGSTQNGGRDKPRPSTVTPRSEENRGHKPLKQPAAAPRPPAPPAPPRQQGGG